MFGLRHPLDTYPSQQISLGRTIRSGGKMKEDLQWSSNSSWAKIMFCFTRSYVPLHSQAPARNGSYLPNSQLQSISSIRVESFLKVIISVSSEISVSKLAFLLSVGGTISFEFDPNPLIANLAGLISHRNAIRNF